MLRFDNWRLGMFGLDVNGYDNTPEWGYCEAPGGCKEEAFPLWLSGGYHDDPDLLLCSTHIGAHILAAEQARNAALALAEVRQRELDGAVAHVKALKAEVAELRRARQWARAWKRAAYRERARARALRVTIEALQMQNTPIFGRRSWQDED